MLALSCPSTTQCTGTDSEGREVTFNPQSPGSPTPATIDPNVYVSYVACPSTTQCTGFDQKGAEITFDPVGPGSTSPHIISTHTIQSTFNIGGIACPSTSQWTVAYTYPGGGTNSYQDVQPDRPGQPDAGGAEHVRLI